MFHIWDGRPLKILKKFLNAYRGTMNFGYMWGYFARSKSYNVISISSWNTIHILQNEYSAHYLFYTVRVVISKNSLFSTNIYVRVVQKSIRILTYQNVWDHGLNVYKSIKTLIGTNLIGSHLAMDMTKIVEKSLYQNHT